jgi:hypothetical protein
MTEINLEKRNLVLKGINDVKTELVKILNEELPTTDGIAEKLIPWFSNQSKLADQSEDRYYVFTGIHLALSKVVEIIEDDSVLFITSNQILEKFTSWYDSISNRLPSFEELFHLQSEEYRKEID